MRLWLVESGLRAGDYNMALDEVLLEWVRAASAEAPCLIVRTYCWERPTLSLGVNQPARDVPDLLALYRQPDGKTPGLVRRPTGGRAILHGADVSFSFVTNDPALLKQSLKESYRFLTAFVERALRQCALAPRMSEEPSGRAYLRSPVCFQTQTPSDLLAPSGEKLVGSAQLRRAGGLLQHGAAFIQPHGITPAAFTQALFAATAEHYGVTPTLLSLEPLADSLEERVVAYRNESRGILANVATTSGSHLEPASP